MRRIFPIAEILSFHAAIAGVFFTKRCGAGLLHRIFILCLLPY